MPIYFSPLSDLFVSEIICEFCGIFIILAYVQNKKIKLQLTMLISFRNMMTDYKKYKNICNILFYKKIKRSPVSVTKLHYIVSQRGQSVQ